MDLSPQQFHGTSADLHPGDRVLPRKQSGAENNFSGMRTTGGRSTGSVAFSTTDEGTAWNFADTAANNQNPAGRTSVLRVNPHPEQEPGAFHEKRMPTGGIPGEMIAPHYDVADRIDTRPGQQGTFPLNWNQFAKKGMTSIEDGFNHPLDEDIEGGHPGGALHRESLAKNWGLDDLMDGHDEELASDKKQGRLW